MSDTLCLQVLIIDELEVSNDDSKRMKAGQTSELEETLAWLADNTAMNLAALSSSSLLDTSRSDVPKTQFDEMNPRTGFNVVRLDNIMRSSQNIAAATSTASVNETRGSSYKIKETISPGSSSTVPGTRPKAMLYKHTLSVDYTKVARFVSQHLNTLPSGIKVAVLCDWGISARQISYRLSSDKPVSCYDGGVEKFYGDDTPEYRKGGAGDAGEEDLCQWLEADHGVLVTSEIQFRGCEADAVICVTRDWAGYTGTGRSPLTRAVAHLCLITNDHLLNVQKMRKYWEVEIMEKGVRE